MQLSRYMKAVIATTALLTIGTIYTEETFLTLLLGWVVLIPIVSCGYLIYGLVEYRKERKNRIVISVKPHSITERYAEIILKEEGIRREKEVLYKQLRNGKKGI